MNEGRTVFAQLLDVGSFWMAMVNLLKMLEHQINHACPELHFEMKDTLILLALLCAATLPWRSPAREIPETKEQRDVRMAWWRDAKFGMFIHLGVYSVPAGYYHDQPVAGIGENVEDGWTGIAFIETSLKSAASNDR
jgi:hypothetical protein